MRETRSCGINRADFNVSGKTSNAARQLLTFQDFTRNILKSKTLRNPVRTKSQQRPSNQDFASFDLKIISKTETGTIARQLLIFQDFTRNIFKSKTLRNPVQTKSKQHPSNQYFADLDLKKIVGEIYRASRAAAKECSPRRKPWVNK